MYFNGSETYYSSDGEQRFRRAPFLILATSKPGDDLYACIRQVALRQCGHFMMGQARIADMRLILSGSYGSDGLPEDYDRLSIRAREKFVRVPDAISELYWHPEHTGHNSAGSEARAMAAYARVLENPNKWPQDNPLIGVTPEHWLNVFYRPILPDRPEHFYVDGTPHWGFGSMPDSSELTRNYSELLERFDGKRAWYSHTGRLAQTNSERIVRASFRWGYDR